MMKQGFAVLATVVTMFAAPAAAQGATQLVSTTGTDSADCTVTPCLHIQQAVNVAAAGDTVSIAAGTYATEPNNQVLVNKGLTITGAGIGQTFLDGNDAHSLPQQGTLSVQSPAAVNVSGLTIVNPGSLAAAHGADNHRAIYTRSLVNAAVAPTYTFNQVRAEGEGPNGRDYGFAVVGSTADVVITNSQFFAQDLNGILVERNQGSVTVTGNTVTRVAGTTLSSAIFDMNYSPALAGVTNGVAEGHAYSDNVIDAAGSSGIVVSARPASGTPPLGGYQSATIDGNTISNVGAATLAISLSNDTTDADGSDAEIQHADVTDNTITGTGGTSIALRLRGLISDIDVSGNDISGFVRGVQLSTAAAGHEPAAALVNRNRFVNNATAQIDNAAGAIVDAQNNWWGCNEGPVVNVADCGDVTGGNVDYDPWLTLRVSAAPTSVEVGGQNSTVTANLNFNSAGANVGTVHRNGFPVAWSTDLGTIAPPSSPLAAGVATSTLTSGATAGTANPAAKVDNETTSTPVQFTDTGIPETVISSGPTNGVTISQTSASFEFSSPNDPAATFQCRIDSSDPVAWAACTSPQAYAGLAEGAHVFEVRAVDVNNNADPSPARGVFNVDTTPPPVTTPAPTTPGGGVAGEQAEGKAAGACDNRIAGNRDANDLDGTEMGDRILGFGADDSLKGNAGYDCLKGGKNDDNLDGGVAGDILQGGSGSDSLSSRDGKRDKLNCGAGDDVALVDQRDVVKGCETLRVAIRKSPRSRG